MTLFACAAFYIGDMAFVKALSFSPMIVGIILGMLYANSLRNNRNVCSGSASYSMVSSSPSRM